MDDYERRPNNNGGRDFFQQQNRFGPGNGPRGPPMGMGRGGLPPYGHRGGPIFMRGPRPGKIQSFSFLFKVGTSTRSLFQQKLIDNIFLFFFKRKLP